MIRVHNHVWGLLANIAITIIEVINEEGSHEDSAPLPTPVQAHLWANEVRLAWSLSSASSCSGVSSVTS